MQSLLRIIAVARIEAKLLVRSWKFWIFTVLGFLLLVGVILYYTILYHYPGYLIHQFASFIHLALLI